MAAPLEQRMARVEGLALAHGVAIRALVSHLVRNKNSRAEMRSIVCDSIEKVYSDRRTNDLIHQVLQTAIDEAEKLFA